MNKEKFLELLNAYKKALDTTEEMYDYIRIGLVDDHFKFIHLLLDSIFTKDGAEWLSWYANETNFQRGKKYDANDGENLICQNDEELYDYLSKNKYFNV
jgi:hypothetical protein